jgi:hypothetical protein
MGIYSGMLAVYGGVFDEYYAQNWGDLMLYINQKHFTPEYMGCYGGKYANH